MSSLFQLLTAWLSWLVPTVNASPTPRNAVLRVLHELKMRADDTLNNGTTSVDTLSILRKQYTNPAEILSVLLIIGGDIVHQAIAQLSGSRLTPVSFSFGWVAYTFTTLIDVFGDGIFMPEPDIPSKVMTIGGGNKWNESWVVSRLVRDLEIIHLRTYNKRQLDSGLIATVYQTQPLETKLADIEPDEAQRPKYKQDYVWRLSWGVFLIQPIVAAIPYWWHQNWDILFVTCTGMVLALITGSLPQYAKEKYYCRRKSKQDYIITRGNGHRHVFLLLHKEGDPDAEGKRPSLSLAIEDLANHAPDIVRASRKTRLAFAILALCWIFLLITIGGMSQDTWFLFIVGAVGMVHNVWVAAKTRDPEGHGIPLKRIAKPIGLRSETDPDRPKVMAGLDVLEQMYPGAGLALVDEFFPTGLRPDEEPRWIVFKETVKDKVQRNIDLSKLPADQQPTKPPAVQGETPGPAPPGGDLSK